MRRSPLILLSTILSVLLAACGRVGGGGGATTATSGPPANAVRVSIAYSPEKEKWLTEQITRFNAQKADLGGRPVFVEGVNKSSGAARTEIKNGTLQVTVWSPSASTWLEVLKQETGNANIAISNEPLVLTPVVIGMWRPMAEAMGWPNTNPSVGPICLS